MSEPDEQPEGVQWTVHPLKRSLTAALCVSGVVAAIPLLVLIAYGDPWLSLVALLVMFFSLRVFYFPTRYTLDSEGVAFSCFPFRVRRPWTAFKGFRALEGAVRLSTFPSPSRLDAYRGLLLRYEGNGGRILEYVKEHIPGGDVSEHGTARG